MQSLNLVVTQHSSTDAKIALFRSLFRGRDDVYPRRYESRKTGKSGYAPACANEWIRGVCEKPRIKCADCPNRRFLSLHEAVIRWHLSGRDDTGQPFVAGIYPMLLDETCFFLAIDFDKQSWIDDVRAIVDTCREMNLPVALERSRSGRGAHVWFFFAEAIPANVARRLGSYVLTESMERRPDIGFQSYDRFFPSQDTLPQGGFGNLIALPLQKAARERGNSVFIDDQLVPHFDQWAFLSSIRRLERAEVDRVVGEGERRGRIVGLRLPVDDERDEPWKSSPSRRPARPADPTDLPSSLELILGNEIYIAKQGLSPWLTNQIIRLAAFQNPEFYRAQAMRLPTYGKPRVISGAEDHSAHIGLPRGCLDDVRGFLHDLEIPITVRDERTAGTTIDATFQGTLRPDQERAAEALLAHETGVLAATTAFGKTVLAAWLIAKRGVNTLVLVHRRQLLDQWSNASQRFWAWRRRRLGASVPGETSPPDTSTSPLFRV